jgi:hypothetical protein
MATQRSSADVVAINTTEEIVGIIQEAETTHPEVKLFPASPVEKTTYKTIVRTVLPTAGFRAINAGRTRSRGTIAARTVECKFLDGSWDMDQAALSGVDWGDPILDETSASLLAVLATFCKQIWYGTDNDSAGFSGVAQILDDSDDDMVVDAGGTTADTASSVFAVKFGLRHAALAWGNDGEITAGEIVEQQLYDGSSDPYMGIAQAIHGWAGLQITNYKAIGRICNLTADSGKGLTDDLIADLLEQFPIGGKPDALFMSQRSQRQLQDSRTATNPTGNPAPFPNEAFGVPIEPTDSIINTEALLTAA